MALERLPLVHLNLTVSDLDRSVAFYRRWFGFTAPPRTYPDGTVFLGNEDGFDLALHPGALTGPPSRTVHFGFRSAEADPVRTLLGDLVAADVTVTERHDTDDYVSLKCLDPDGYEIEVYWEPRM
jgi:catechol 2,3-dioxygenase-like lactoylglutathione lyase family enzyme